MLFGKNKPQIVLKLGLQPAVNRHLKNFDIVRKKCIGVNINFCSMIYLQKCTQAAAMVGMTVGNNHNVHGFDVHAAPLGVV